MVNIHDVLREISSLDVVSSQSPKKTQQRAALRKKNKEMGMEREGKRGKGKGGNRRRRGKGRKGYKGRHDRIHQVMYEKPWAIPHATWCRFATTFNTELSFIAL